MLKERALNIYTDGSMLPSPRSGGIGIIFVVINAGGDAEIIRSIDSPGFKQSTNQEMELEACIVALDEALYDSNLAIYSEIEVFTDSMYVQGNYKKALFSWPKTQWKSRSTRRPILHVEQWKRLVKLFQYAHRTRRRVNINWVKGHKGNPYNKAADKAAKRSARNPLNPPKAVVSVRRKMSEEKTAIGSVKMLGQRLDVRIITAQYLGSPHRLWKYKYEVLTSESDYFGKVDEIFSELCLRDGHHYEVLVNAETANPRILELVREIDRSPASG
jgi:ribonuclease HI